MTWSTIRLNDGTEIPNIAYGTGSLGSGGKVTDCVGDSITAGFKHIDTAQSYGNEEETGKAIRESGLKREDIYITTKFSGRGNFSIAESMQNSLRFLGVDYVDLYLIHAPIFALPDIPTAWAEMEKVKARGYAKSIGVSNFTVPDLRILIDSAKVTPAVNQIRFHPYIITEQLPIIEFGQKYGIVAEGYSPLLPVRRFPGGALDKPLSDISARLSAPVEQVLIAWAKSKGVVVITSSTKKERMEGYLAAGDLALTAEDIALLDEAGAKGPPPQ